MDGRGAHPPNTPGLQKKPTARSNAYHRHAFAVHGGLTFAVCTGGAARKYEGGI